MGAIINAHAERQIGTLEGQFQQDWKMQYRGPKLSSEQKATGREICRKAMGRIFPKFVP